MENTMSKETKKELTFHSDCISAFNAELYDNIFTDENVVSKQKAIKLGDKKYYGYFLEKGKSSYFVPSEFITEIPFKVTKKVTTDYKSDVFDVIIDCEGITIPAEKRMSLRELTDTIANFSHSNPLHFKLYKLVALAAYIDRINARISTDAGFGKDSVVNIISALVNSTYNMYGGTFAKLEFALVNKLIVLNELGHLKPDDKFNFQEFLLAVGAYFNIYTKRTRKTGTTQEQYDIGKLSLMIFYNLPSYYVSKNQEYFDQIFTKAVINRFLPFVFEGTITTKFEKLVDPAEIVAEYKDVYKDVIATINHFRAHPVMEIKFKVPETIKFTKEFMRYDRTFNVIMKYISEYSRTQEEFDLLTKELYKCYQNYDKLTHIEKVDDAPVDLQKAIDFK